jgi:hypothetical protein
MRCIDYRPDHSGRCLTCHQSFDVHLPAGARTTPVVISARDVGSHVGTEGVVRRAKGRRVIHVTDPHPFHAAARDAAKRWAVAHGYLHIEEEQ